MARVEPEVVDPIRWPELVAPESEAGTGRRGASREIRDALRAAAPELGMRFEFPDDSSFGSLDAETTVVLRRPVSFFSRIAAQGTPGLAESYMAGEWIAGDLPAVVAALVPWLANHPDLETVRRHRSGRGLGQVRGPGHRRRAQTGGEEAWMTDLEMGIPGDLVALFSDPTMATSAALFASGARSRRTDSRGRTVIHVSAPPTPPHRLDLGDAQRRAHDVLLGLAEVGNGSRVVVAPPGWGELPLRAAECGAQVRGVTESIDRLNVVGARIRAAGQSNAVTLSLGEFGDIAGEADAVVALEPCAQGSDAFAAVLEKSSAILPLGGTLAAQLAVGSDAHAAEISELVAWRRQYIDERSGIPLRSDLKSAFERHQGMELRGRIEFGEHAAHTARLWRENLSIRGRDAAAQGFDPVYRRMWQFHLATVETSYAAGWVDAWQIVATA